MLGIPEKLLREEKEKFEEKIQQRITVAMHLKTQGLDSYGKRRI